MREEIRSPLPLVTIVICTYNRAYILGECLRSLQAQTLPTCFFNIIVVDNDSNDATQALVKDFSHDWPQLKFIIEKKRGAGNARNAALKKVTTDWVACLDSDAKAHPDWLATVLETIKNDDFDAFGGPYYAWHFFGAPPKWFPKDFGTYEAAQSYGPLSDANHIPGGNCAFKLSAAQTVGCFPVDIGMTGKKCAYGEETLMFDRMKAAGFRLGYVPAMKIDHCVLPYKYSFFWQMKSYLARGESNYQITFDHTKVLTTIISIGSRFIFSCGKLFIMLAYSLACGWHPQHRQNITKHISRVVFYLGQLKAACLQKLNPSSYDK